MATDDTRNGPSIHERRLLTEQKWRGIVAEFEKSDLKQSEFCRQRGIPTHRMSWWKRQILIRDGKLPSPKKSKRSAMGPGRETKPKTGFSLGPPGAPVLLHWVGSGSLGWCSFLFLLHLCFFPRNSAKSSLVPGLLPSEWLLL